MTYLENILKSRDITLPKNVCEVKAMVFLIIMFGYKSRTIKKSWVLKNWSFWTVMLEKTLESPLGSKEIKPLHPKGNQSWIFIGRSDAEAEISVIQPPDAESQLIGKYPDAGTDWRQQVKEMTEDKMVGWHHQLGRKFEHALGVGVGQGSLACCSPWGRKESDTTESLNWTDI